MEDSILSRVFDALPQLSLKYLKLLFIFDQKAERHARIQLGHVQGL
jgi:hypothetical protein